MLKWYAFLGLLGASVGIFIFAPLGLVGHFISEFTPPGLEWVGTAFSAGLSLSVVSNSFLARWKSMRSALVSLIVLAVAESVMAGATLYGQALAGGKLDALIGLGILAIVAMQEAVLISGGLGMSMVLDKIGVEQQAREHKRERAADRAANRNPGLSANTSEAPSPAPVAATRRRLSHLARLDAIRRANESRNGDGLLTAAEIVAAYGVSLRQAQRDVASVAGAGRATEGNE